jgi:hypothetical protein
MTSEPGFPWEAPTEYGHQSIEIEVSYRPTRRSTRALARSPGARISTG